MGLLGIAVVPSVLETRLPEFFQEKQGKKIMKN
jgi:hypothetical protein